MISRSESMNFVTSCHQVESTVINAQVGAVWEALRSFELSKLFPTNIKNVKFTSGNANEVGSTFQIEYTDGSVWTYKILEISDSKRVLSYELITAEPEIAFSSLQHTIKVFKVTEDNSTYFAWESDFSNDVNSHILQDTKFKKLDAFKDLKKHFSK